MTYYLYNVHDDVHMIRKIWRRKTRYKKACGKELYKRRVFFIKYKCILYIYIFFHFI